MTILVLTSCDKEYFPDDKKFRDSSLFGTWIKVQSVNDELPTVFVYNSKGYCGGTTAFINSNTSELSYQNIDGIWYVEERNAENNLIHSQKRFRNGIWEHTEEYYFQNDTLFLRDLSYDWDTLVLYKHQLIYDGPDYVEIDSTWIE